MRQIKAGRSIEQDRLLTYTLHIVDYHPFPQLLSHNEYDELGQLIKKKRGRHQHFWRSQFAKSRLPL
jgi:hypothetical protein